MILSSTKKQGGFVKMILLIVLILIVLGYFGFNLESIVKSPTVHSNLEYVWNLITTVWDKFLATPVRFIWDKIIIGIVWNSLVNLISLGGGAH